MSDDNDIQPRTQKTAEQYRQEAQRGGILAKAKFIGKALIPGSDVRKALNNSGSSGGGGGEGPSLHEYTKDVLAGDIYTFEPRHSKIGSKYARTYWSIRFPSSPSPLFLTAPGGESDGISLFDYPFYHRLLPEKSWKDTDIDISLHIDPYEDTEAVRELKLREQELKEGQLGNFSSPSRQSREEKAENNFNLKKQVQEDRGTLFDISLHTTLRSNSLQTLNDLSRQFKNHIGSGRDPVDQLALPHEQKSLLQTTQPLARNERDRGRYANAEAIANMFPLGASHIIDQNGILYGQHAGSQAPVIYDPFSEGNGYNRATFGSIGAGKTFDTALNLARAKARYDDLLVFAIGPFGDDEEDTSPFAEIARHFGGEGVSIGGSKGINPLHIEETDPDNISGQDVNPLEDKLQEAKIFFATFFQSEGHEVNMGLLERLLKELYNEFDITRDIQTHSNPSPTVNDFLDMLDRRIEDPDQYMDTTGGSDQLIETHRQNLYEIRNALSAFDGGRYANLAGESDISFSSSDLMYFDISPLESTADEAMKTLYMNLLFSTLYERSKGSEKVLFVIDEAHYLLKNALLQERLKTAVLHSRHYDLSLHFVTQEVSEFTKNEVTRSILNNLRTIMLHQLDNPGKFQDDLNLTDGEVKFVREARSGSEGGGGQRYSEGLFYINEYDGYIPLNVVATPAEQDLLSGELTTLS